MKRPVDAKKSTSMDQDIGNAGKLYTGYHSYLVLLLISRRGECNLM
jgi:hypothetical protein